MCVSERTRRMCSGGGDEPTDASGLELGVSFTKAGLKIETQILTLKKYNRAIASQLSVMECAAGTFFSFFSLFFYSCVELNSYSRIFYACKRYGPTVDLAWPFRVLHCCRIFTLTLTFTVVIFCIRF